ncbi:MAG: hypothetical protein ACREDS_00550, partial [Limisphaerales bacterium]
LEGGPLAAEVADLSFKGNEHCEGWAACRTKISRNRIKRVPDFILAHCLIHVPLLCKCGVATVAVALPPRVRSIV